MRLLISALLLPAAALAGSRFDGTWKTNIGSLRTTGKPMALLLAKGQYTCSSCNPPYTVKADGAALTSRVTNHEGAQTVTDEFTAQRVAAAPVGAHPISGSWQDQQHLRGNLRMVQYRMTAEGFQMRWNGQSYEARFDGREYPVVGDPGKTTVSVRRIDDATVEETDHRQGMIVDQIRLALAKDGNTIAVTDQDVALGQTSTYRLEKQR